MAIVTVFSVAEKFLGFIYRIFLSRTIGSEGMGIYQIALSVFAVLLTVSCSGTPITVSRLMTKYKAKNQKKKEQSVISAGILLSIIVSLPLSALLFFGHGMFDFLFTDSRCMTVFLIVLPSLTFNCVYAVLRGVFWGNKDFLPYSIIELLEEIVMIIAGIVLITHATNVFDGAKRAGMAVLISYIFSFIVGTAVFLMRGGRLKNPKNEFVPLISSALPITAMRTANSLINSLVSIILPLRLVAAGMTGAEALSQFGSAFGMAMPLLFVPSTIVSSFTLVLIPEISENYYKKHTKTLKNNIEKAIKLTVFVACMFIPVFFVLGEEIGMLVYNDALSGKYLSHSALLMFPMGISALTTSILNSMGLEKKTLFYYVISAIFMLACIWFLPQVLGVYSLVAGFIIVFGLTALLNAKLINKRIGEKLQLTKFLLLAAVFLIPVTVLGLLLEKLLIHYIGNLLTLLVIGGIIVVCNALLYAVFNLVDISRFFNRALFDKLRNKCKRSERKKHVQ